MEKNSLPLTFPRNIYLLIFKPLLGTLEILKLEFQHDKKQNRDSWNLCGFFIWLINSISLMTPKSHQTFTIKSICVPSSTIACLLSRAFKFIWAISKTVDYDCYYSLCNLEALFPSHSLSIYMILLRWQDSHAYRTQKSSSLRGDKNTMRKSSNDVCMSSQGCCYLSFGTHFPHQFSIFALSFFASSTIDNCLFLALEIPNESVSFRWLINLCKKNLNAKDTISFFQLIFKDFLCNQILPTILIWLFSSIFTFQLSSFPPSSCQTFYTPPPQLYHYFIIFTTDSILKFSCLWTCNFLLLKRSYFLHKFSHHFFFRNFCKHLNFWSSPTDSST